MALKKTIAGHAGDDAAKMIVAGIALDVNEARSCLYISSIKQVTIGDLPPTPSM